MFTRPMLLLVMMAFASTPACAAGTKRTYYIAAEDVLWNYAPSFPTNPMSGNEFTEDQKIFVEGNGSDRIGRVYRKARFVEYTDESFGTLKERPPEWEHLGILGPPIFANVGDTVEVVFKNKTADKVTSLHPHGLFYAKDSEGTPYNDGTDNAAKSDDRVSPGDTYTYTWKVPQRAGPGPGDRNSLVWLYHSHVNEPADTNAGLVGPIIVSEKDARQPDGKLRGIDREFVVLFTVFDENASFYLDENIAEFAPNADRDDEDFQESNLMHAMNGYLFGDLPGLVMSKGENVRWHQLSLGTEVDLHTPHWHGNTLLFGRRRADSVNLLPATQHTLDMRPDSAGTWMYHCHVNDHLSAGMMGLYRVDP